MTVKYINSKNEVLEFIGADILPTSGICIRENGIQTRKMILQLLIRVTVLIL